MNDNRQKEKDRKKIQDSINRVQVPDFLEQDLLQLQYEGKPGKAYNRHSKWRAVAAAFAVVLLIGTGTYAAVKEWRFSDYFHLGEVSEDVNQIVNTEVNADNLKDLTEDEWGTPIQKDTEIEVKDLLTVTPTMTVYDSHSVYISLEAALKDTERYWLMDASEDLEQPASTITGDESTTQSVEKYCKEHDISIVLVNARYNSYDEHVEDQGTDMSVKGKGVNELLLCGTRRNTEELEKVGVIYTVYIYNTNKREYELVADKQLDIAMPELSDETKKEQTVTYGLADGTEQQIGDSSVKVSKVILTTTSIATYAEIYVRDEDTDAHPEGVSVSLVNAEHKELPTGPSRRGVISVPDGKGQFVSKMDYARWDTFPDTIYVKAFVFTQRGKELAGYVELHRLDQ